MDDDLQRGIGSIPHRTCRCPSLVVGPCLWLPLATFGIGRHPLLCWHTPARAEAWRVMAPGVVPNVRSLLISLDSLSDPVQVGPKEKETPTNKISEYLPSLFFSNENVGKSVRPPNSAHG